MIPRKLNCWSCCLAIAILFGSSKVFADNENGPVLEASSLEYNFGTDFEHRIVTCKFTITNRGTDLLVIDDVQGSCGCTYPEIDAYQLDPGSSATLTVHVKLHGKSGNVSESVLLKTNEGSNNSTHVFKIKGTVSPDVKVDPYAAYLYDLYYLDNKQAVVNVTCNNNSFILKEGAVECDDPRIKCEVVEAETSGSNSRKYRLVVQAIPPMSIGKNIDVEIKIPVLKGDRETLPIHVYGKVVGDFVVTPDNLVVLDRGVEGDSVTRILLLHQTTDNTSTSFSIEKIESALGPLNYDELESSDPKVLVLRLTIPVNERISRGDIVIHLRSPGQESTDLKIPIVVINPAGTGDERDQTSHEGRRVHSPTSVGERG